MVSNTQNNNQSPLIEINPAFTNLKPQDEVIDLVRQCVDLYGYPRNEIKTAFFRALSLPALDTYINTDKRCRAAIDIVIHKLESRFPSKSKLEYGWKGVSSRITGLEVVDEYGNVLFSTPWISTPDPVTPIIPATSAPVNSEPSAQDIDSIYSPAHELARSPVNPDDSLEMLQLLKKIDSKLDILISMGRV